MAQPNQPLLLISLVHPSRGRPSKAMTTALHWIKTSTQDVEIEYILSTDSDEKSKNLYDSWSKEYLKPIVYAFHHSTTTNNNVVQAMNAGAKYATGEIVIGMSDDFFSPPQWDSELTSSGDWSTDLAVHVNDTITGADQKCMTLPILSKSLLAKLGYIYYPGYSGMFADNDLYEACEKLGCLVLRHDLQFEHRHWLNSKAPKDATYMRHNTEASWAIGKKLIAQRRLTQFT